MQMLARLIWVFALISSSVAMANPAINSCTLQNVTASSQLGSLMPILGYFASVSPKKCADAAEKTNADCLSSAKCVWYFDILEKSKVTESWCYHSREEATRARDAAVNLSKMVADYFKSPITAERSEVYCGACKPNASSLALSGKAEETFQNAKAAYQEWRKRLKAALIPLAKAAADGKIPGKKAIWLEYSKTLIDAEKKLRELKVQLEETSKSGVLGDLGKLFRELNDLGAKAEQKFSNLPEDMKLAAAPDLDAADGWETLPGGAVGTVETPYVNGPPAGWQAKGNIFYSADQQGADYVAGRKNGVYYRLDRRYGLFIARDPKFFKGPIPTDRSIKDSDIAPDSGADNQTHFWMRIWEYRDGKPVWDAVLEHWDEQALTRHVPLAAKIAQTPPGPEKDTLIAQFTKISHDLTVMQPQAAQISFPESPILKAAEQTAVKTSFPKGVAALDNGNLAQAEKFLKKAIATEPANAQAHEALGDVYFKKGDAAAALSSYQSSQAAKGGMSSQSQVTPEKAEASRAWLAKQSSVFPKVLTTYLGTGLGGFPLSLSNSRAVTFDMSSSCTLKVRVSSLIADSAGGQKGCEDVHQISLKDLAAGYTVDPPLPMPHQIAAPSGATVQPQYSGGHKAVSYLKLKGPAILNRTCTKGFLDSGQFQYGEITLPFADPILAKQVGEKIGQVKADCP